MEVAFHHRRSGDDRDRVRSLLRPAELPRTTTWLTEEERALAVWRLEEDIGEDDWVSSEQQTFWQGAVLAFTDVKTYVLVSFIHRPSSP